MRALVLRDFYDIAVEERPEPQPRPGEVVVAGDRHRHLRVGLPRLLGRERAAPPRPGDGTRDSRSDRRAGLRGSRARGRPAGHRKPGDVAAMSARPACLVRSSGALGGSCLASHQRSRRPLPTGLQYRPRTSCRYRDDMPEELGALVEPMAVGYHAIRRGLPRPEDRVLVIGGGPIGQACLLAARRLGVEALALSDVSQSRRNLCARLGAEVIDPSVGDLAEAVAERLGGPATLGRRRGRSERGRWPTRWPPPALGGRIVLVGMGIAAARAVCVRDQHRGASADRVVHLQRCRVRRHRGMGRHRPGRDRRADRRPGRLGRGAAELRRPRARPKHGEQDPGLPARAASRSESA